MVCKNCGKEIQEGWKICPHCGAKIEKEDGYVGSEDTIQEKEVKKGKSIIPGFRTNTLWKKVVALLGYTIFFLELFEIVTSKTYGNSTDQVIYRVEQFAIYIFIFFVVLIIGFNFMGIRDRLPFFKKHKIGSTILGIYLTLVFVSIVGSAIGYASESLYSDSYITEKEAAKEEEARKEEEAKKQEEAKKEEEARKQEEAKKEEEAKKQEEARKEEEAKKQEEARKEEEAKKQEEAKKEEEAKKQEATKKQDEETTKYSTDTKTESDSNGVVNTTDNTPNQYGYFTPDFYNAYIEQNDIDIYSFEKEEEKIIKYFNEYDYRDGVYVTKDSSGCYKVSAKETDLMYFGEKKKNKPNGMGAVFQLVDVSGENIDSLHIKKVGFTTSDEYLVRLYMGNFKNGKYDGFGVEFKSPIDEEYTSQGVDIEKFVQNIDNDIQASIFGSLNPIVYEGNFKKGLYSGKGNQFLYISVYFNFDTTFTNAGNDADENADLTEREKKLNEIARGQNRDITINSGTFKDGKMNGKVQIYEFGYLSYSGEMKNDEKNGKGTIFYPCSKQIQYEGGLKNGLYNGKGVLYNQEGRKVCSGKWKKGEYVD